MRGAFSAAWPGGSLTPPGFGCTRYPSSRHRKRMQMLRACQARCEDALELGRSRRRSGDLRGPIVRAERANGTVTGSLPMPRHQSVPGQLSCSVPQIDLRSLTERQEDAGADLLCGAEVTQTSATGKFQEARPPDSQFIDCDEAIASGIPTPDAAPALDNRASDASSMQMCNQGPMPLPAISLAAHKQDRHPLLFTCDKLANKDAAWRKQIGPAVAEAWPGGSSSKHVEKLIVLGLMAASASAHCRDHINCPM